MKYRTLGRTGLQVSEVGSGRRVVQRIDRPRRASAIVDAAQQNGVNYIDIFMPQAPTRDHLGAALEGQPGEIYRYRGICALYYEDGQYTRTRDIEKTKRSFEDLLERLHTDYIDVGMIHYVDSEEDFRTVFEGPVLAYAKELKEKGVIRHHRHEFPQPAYCLKSGRERGCGCADVQHQPRL